jgi:lipopolysaccharide transport system ATP-binding protein
MKHYSTGMYARLAFAVAANLEPDILIVDEVLAVGDATFQNKCLGKLGAVAQEGRTVIFVSHNLSAVLSLCNRALLLEGGRIVADGATRDVIATYLQSVQAVTQQNLQDRTDRKGNGSLRFVSYFIEDEGGEPTTQVLSGDTISIKFSYKSQSAEVLQRVQVSLQFYGKFGEPAFFIGTHYDGFDLEQLQSEGTIGLTIPDLPLQPGRYSFDIRVELNGILADFVEHAGVIPVESGDFFGSGRLPPSETGSFLMRHKWLSEGIPTVNVQAQVDERI